MFRICFCFLGQVNGHVDSDVMEFTTHKRPDFAPGETAESAAQSRESDGFYFFLFKISPKPFQAGFNIFQTRILLPAAFRGEEQKPLGGVRCLNWPTRLVGEFLVQRGFTLVQAGPGSGYTLQAAHVLVGNVNVRELVLGS